jgi:hypothetical protein
VGGGGTALAAARRSLSRLQCRLLGRLLCRRAAGSPSTARPSARSSRWRPCAGGGSLRALVVAAHALRPWRPSAPGALLAWWGNPPALTERRAACCAARPPLSAAMLIGMAGNIMKQNAISPPPKDPEMATEEESGRGGRLGLGGRLGGEACPEAGMRLRLQMAGQLRACCGGGGRTAEMEGAMTRHAARPCSAQLPPRAPLGPRADAPPGPPPCRSRAQLCAGRAAGAAGHRGRRAAVQLPGGADAGQGGAACLPQELLHCGARPSCCCCCCCMGAMALRACLRACVPGRRLVQAVVALAQAGAGLVAAGGGQRLPWLG